ncbi:MAG: DUF4153 domain-containing protein [Patescibacteria group bacterium]
MQKTLTSNSQSNNFGWLDFKKAVRETTMRFPVTMLVAIIGSAGAVWLIASDFTNEVLIKVVWTLVVVFPLLISIEWWRQRRQLKNWISLVLYVLVAVFILLNYWFFPATNQVTQAYVLGELLWVAIFILLLTMVPGQKNNVINDDFWRHNLIWLGALVMTGILCVLLVSGVFIALGTVENLFQLSYFDYHIYPQLWTIIVGIIGSTFFLSQIEAEWMVESKVTQALIRIGQFVLIPLVIVYFVILYVYSGMVFFQGDWPDVMVSYMIIGFSIVGILTTFFLYPLQKQYGWMKWLVRLLFVAIIPQVAVLFWALSFPLSRYGLTENRYLVLLFGLWLVISAIYMLVSRQKDWRFLPLTLMVMLILAATGPWGVVNVSKRNQIGRLERIASSVGMFSDGYLHPTDQLVPIDEAREISNIVIYLINNHGLAAVKPLLAAGSVDDLEVEGLIGYSLAEKIVTEKLGLPFYDEASALSDAFNFYHNGEQIQNTVTNISGYDYVFELVSPAVADKTEYVDLADKRYRVSFDLERATMVLVDEADGQEINFDLTDFIKQLHETYPGSDNNLPAADLTVAVADKNVQVKMVFITLGGKMEDGRPVLDYLDAMVYITIDAELSKI